MSSTQDLSDRRILVTGAANGLGLGIARRLAMGGARLILVDKDPALPERLADPCFAGLSACAVQDLAESGAPHALIEQATQRYGSINGLVNCAAWSLHKAAVDISSEEFDRLVAINQRAPFFLCQGFATQLRESDLDPCVVNISSVNAIVGNANLAAYAGTKAALLAFTRALAVEFAPRIRFVALSPGAVQTHVTQQLIEQGRINPSQLLERFLVKRFITVEEIGELVAFLFGPTAKSITGCNWIYDGGYTAQ